MPTWSRRQSGETYMVYLCGRPLRNRGRCTLGRETAIQPMTWSADGWLRTTTGEGIPSVEVAAPRGLTPQPHPPDACSRGVRRRHAADRVSMAAIAVARRVVQPPRAEGPPASLRARDDRQSLHTGARRPSSTIALLQRVDDRRGRARALSADGRPGVLLQQLQVPLLLRLARRGERQAPSRHVGASRSSDVGRVHAADRRRRAACRSSCVSKWTTSGCASRIG